MERRGFILAVLFSLCSWIQAEDYQVPGTSISIPKLDGTEENAALLGLAWKEPPAPAIMIQVVRNLGRKSMWNAKSMETLSINGIDCEIRETDADVQGKKFSVVSATAYVGEQALNMNCYYEIGIADRREAFLGILKGVKFGNPLVTRCQESLPIEFGIILALDYVMIFGTTVILADKNASLTTAKGMTVQAFRLPGGDRATEESLIATCQQMAQKIMGINPEVGKLEKTKIGKLQGFRLASGIPDPTNVKTWAIYTLSWEDLYVILYPSPKSGEAELELFYQQLEKMNETVFVR